MEKSTHEMVDSTQSFRSMGVAASTTCQNRVSDAPGMPFIESMGLTVYRMDDPAEPAAEDLVAGIEHQPDIPLPIKHPVVVIIATVALASFSWVLAPILFSLEDAQAYTLYMGINFDPRVLQVLLYAPALLTLAFLGIECGLSFATLFHKSGLCKAPRRPAVAPLVLLLALAAVAGSLMAHYAVKLTYQLCGSEVASGEVPLLRMFIETAVAYVLVTVAFSKFMCKVKSPMITFVGYLAGFILAPFVAVFVDLAVDIAVAVFVSVVLFRFFVLWHRFQ